MLTQSVIIGFEKTDKIFPDKIIILKYVGFKY